MEKDILLLLKGVSRSFYLSVRVLPSSIRRSVALAYLIARAADTISDTGALKEENRLRVLKDLQHLIQQFKFQNLDAVYAMITETSGHDNAEEKSLLEKLPQVFLWAAKIPVNHVPFFQKVLLTLTQGMVEDLEYFTDRSQTPIKCLAATEDTDRYTYMVAGCVGEFWTNLLLAEKLCDWDAAAMIPVAITFGKGLQWVNILRDFPRDLAMGRCYFSGPELQKYKISLLELGSLFQQPKVSVKIKMTSLYEERIRMARHHLSAGLHYVKSMPRHRLSLRLAVLWPMLIGFKTLAALENKGDRFWQTSEPVKIKRKEVYNIMALSSLVAPSNHILDRYCSHFGGFAR